VCGEKRSGKIVRPRGRNNELAWSSKRAKHEEGLVIDSDSWIKSLKAKCGLKRCQVILFYAGSDTGLVGEVPLSKRTDAVAIPNF
jgi:hypothetical protein